MFSQSSADSGYVCRCSTYSSDTSQQYSECSNYSNQYTSQPINIPVDNAACYSRKTLHSWTTSCQCTSHEYCQPDALFSNAEPSLTSIASDDDIVSDDVIASGHVGSDYQNADINFENKLMYETMSGSSLDEERRSLPEIVNPNNSTDILQRRRSLPRKKRSVLKFVNKMFDSEASNIEGVFENYTNISDVRWSGIRPAENNASSKLYDAVPNRKAKEVIPTEYENVSLSSDKEEVKAAKGELFEPYLL